MNTRLKILLLIPIFFHSCFYLNRTDEEQAKKDVLTYLTNKYHKNFVADTSKWICNEGNGCPDAHLVTCRVLDSSDLKFNIGIIYEGDSFNIWRNDYNLELLNYQAETRINKIIKREIPQFITVVDVLGISLFVEKLSSKDLILEQIVKKYNKQVSFTIDLYLLENDTTKNNKYKKLTKDIIKCFEALPLKELSISIYFYHENKISHLSKEKLKEVFQEEVGCRYCEGVARSWHLLLGNKELESLDSTLANIDNRIEVTVFKKN